MKRIITTFLALTLLCAPCTTYAASPYWKNVKAKAVSEDTIKLSWKALTKAQQKKINGIAVFRDGKAVKKLSKKAKSYNDTDLAGGKYTYQLKTYKKSSKKVTMYWNKKTGKWQAKKISGVKSKKVKKTVYKYANASQKLTAAAVDGPVPTGLTVKTKGSKVIISWNAVEGATQYLIYDFSDKVGQTNETTYTITAEPDETCSISVAARFENGVGKRCKAVNVTIPENGTDSGTDPKPEKKMVEITDYKGTVRTVEEGSADYNNPLYNKNIDGTVYYTGGTKIRLIQKNGVSFEMDTFSDYALSFIVYNGDANKLTYELSVPEVEYTVWGPELYNPTKETATCVIGDHGRRVAKVFRGVDYVPSEKQYRSGIALREGYCGPICDTLTLNIIMKYNGEVLYTHPAILGHDYDKSKDENGLYGSTAKLYKIGKAAVNLYDSGGEVDGWSQKYYQQAKDAYGEYAANMMAITHYVHVMYPYSEIDCWGGAGILLIYSVMDYGIYGHYCQSAPSNPSHLAFRMDYSCENGNFNGLYQTEGHHGGDCVCYKCIPPEN